jgi:inosine/xanthosine triphosphatase
MKVLIATKNQGKIEGARKALLNYFDNVEIEGIPVESNVSEQPVNDEIYAGAKNRVKNLKEYCKQNNVVADLYLSIESGINNSLGRWMITNIAVIEDNNNFESYGTSPSFPVPDRLVQDIINTDLSQVMNKIFEKDDERHNRGGGIQLLTHNKISRIDLTETAFIMALTKYINKDSWR